MNKETIKEVKDIIAHYYVKVIGFSMYLVLIIIVSASAAFFQMQVEHGVRIQTGEPNINNYLSTEPMADEIIPEETATEVKKK